MMICSDGVSFHCFNLGPLFLPSVATVLVEHHVSVQGVSQKLHVREAQPAVSGIGVAEQYRPPGPTWVNGCAVVDSTASNEVKLAR